MQRYAGDMVSPVHLRCPRVEFALCFVNKNTRSGGKAEGFAVRANLDRRPVQSVR